MALGLVVVAGTSWEASLAVDGATRDHFMTGYGWGVRGTTAVEKCCSLLL